METSARHAVGRELNTACLIRRGATRASPSKEQGLEMKSPLAIRDNFFVSLLLTIPTLVWGTCSSSVLRRPLPAWATGCRMTCAVVREKGARTGLCRNVLAINYERVHKPKR